MLYMLGNVRKYDYTACKKQLIKIVLHLTRVLHIVAEHYSLHLAPSFGCPYNIHQSSLWHFRKIFTPFKYFKN